jgi:hypothetical protein
VSAVVAGKAHDDEIGEVGHAGAAGQELAWLEADLAGHVETHWLIGEQVGLFEGLHEVELVPHELALLLVLHLGFDATGVVAHSQQLLLGALE